MVNRGTPPPDSPPTAFVVAAFAERPLTGNPAGVMFLPSLGDSQKLQAIAAALDQPETAFLTAVEGRWKIRWFSPVTEVDLCGHATLAAAKTIWDEGLASPTETLHFDYAAGELAARLDARSQVWLNFPTQFGTRAAAPDAVLAAAGLDPVQSAKHGDRWLLEYSSEAQVRALRPDFGAIVKAGIRSLIVTARSESADFDIISRNFAPIVGIDEDQVTGVAHTCLAPHWQSRLGNDLRCWQASARGGRVLTHLVGERTELGGTAALERRVVMDLAF